MPKDYTLTFVNGVAENVSLPVGTYTYVSNTLKGYSDGTVDSFTVEATSTEINLSVSANGTLKITVTDDLGTAITAGSLQLSDSSGTTGYGTSVSITEGLAQFENVPYDADGISIYVKQDGSDDSHEPIATPEEMTLTTNPQEETILNDRKAIVLKVNITDKNYSGITAISGDLVVNG